MPSYSEEFDVSMVEDLIDGRKRHAGNPLDFPQKESLFSEFSDFGLFFFAHPAPWLRYPGTSFRYFVFLFLGHRWALSSDEWVRNSKFAPSGPTMANVVKVGNIFQVFKGIVGSIAVLVVYFHSLWARTHERTHDKPMGGCESDVPLFCPVKSSMHIPTLVQSLCEYFTGLGGSYSADVGCFVLRTEGYSAPFFGCVSHGASYV